MKPGGGKQKGAQFEREVCVALSRWVSGGTSDSEFWRSAMSGGRATVRVAKGKSADGHGGDIAATGVLGHPLLAHFTVECKFVADLNLRSALIKGVGDLVNHWGQVSGDAKRVGKMPLLIAKQNLMPTLLLVRHTCVARSYFDEARQIELARMFRLGVHAVSMFQFEQFLDTVPYEPTRFS